MLWWNEHHIPGKSTRRTESFTYPGNRTGGRRRWKKKVSNEPWGYSSPSVIRRFVNHIFNPVKRILPNIRNRKSKTSERDSAIEAADSTTETSTDEYRRLPQQAVTQQHSYHTSEMPPEINQLKAEINQLKNEQQALKLELRELKQILLPAPSHPDK